MKVVTLSEEEREILKALSTGEPLREIPMPLRGRRSTNLLPRRPKAGSSPMMDARLSPMTAARQRKTRRRRGPALPNEARYLACPFVANHLSTASGIAFASGLSRGAKPSCVTSELWIAGTLAWTAHIRSAKTAGGQKRPFFVSPKGKLCPLTKGAFSFELRRTTRDDCNLQFITQDRSRWGCSPTGS
jgi:hypothetical protein